MTSRLLLYDIEHSWLSKISVICVVVVVVTGHCRVLQSLLPPIFPKFRFNKMQKLITNSERIHIIFSRPHQLVLHSIPHSSLLPETELSTTVNQEMWFVELMLESCYSGQIINSLIDVLLQEEEPSWTGLSVATRGTSMHEYEEEPIIKTNKGKNTHKRPPRRWATHASIHPHNLADTPLQSSKKAKGTKQAWPERR